MRPKVALALAVATHTLAFVGGAMVLFYSSAACAQTLATQDSVPPSVRAEIAHVKELITHQRELAESNDRRYEQRFVGQEKAVNDALVALEKATAQALTAAKEAVVKAEAASEKRLDSVNEFRDQLRDQANTFIRASEANSKFESMIKDINRLQERIDLKEGAAKGADSLWNYFVAAVGLIIAVTGAFVITRRVRASEEPPHLSRKNGTET